MTEIVELCPSAELVDGGRALIDVTHIDNLVALVAHCVDADLPGNGRAYNVRNAEPVRVHALLKTLFDELAVDTRLIGLPRAPALALTRARATPRALATAKADCVGPAGPA